MRSRLALVSLMVVMSVLASAATPAVQAADPVIAAAGDIACDPASGSFNAGLGTASECRQLYTSDLLAQGAYTAVLPLGDLQYEDGLLVDFLLSYDLSWGRVKQITRPVPGNHEYNTGSAAGYFNYFNGIGSTTGPAGDSSRGYYSYDIGNWHLVALNSNCGAVGGCGPSSPQGQWLLDDLAASGAACTLAYWHHPLFSSGEYSPGIGSVRPLFQTLYEHGADLVLSGHDHNYERFAPQDPSGSLDLSRGVRQFIVGTGGKSNYSQGTPLGNSEVRNASSYGVLELTLRPSGYDWRFVPAAGDTFTDSGSAGCRNATGAGHARPRVAQETHVRLVPASESCTLPTAVHGDPLAVPSCQPPVQSSAYLTVGTPGANGSRAKFNGYLGIRVLGEDPPDSTNGDQADVAISAQLSDVRTATDLVDYVGELQGRLLFRVTDSLGGALLDTAGTTTEVPFSFAIPCAPTVEDPDRGSDCDVTTSIDTLMAGAVAENAGSVWELLDSEVLDGGADGSAATPDNTTFAQPGFFAP